MSSASGPEWRTRGRERPRTPAAAVARRSIGGLAALAILGALVVPAAAADASPAAAAASDGSTAQILVRWLPDVDAATRRDVLADLAPGSDGRPRAVTERVDAVAVPGDVHATVERLSAAPAVEAAEADRPIVTHTIVPTGDVDPREATGTTFSTAAAGEPSEPPDDPLYPLQWGLENTGQSVGPEDDQTTGTAGVDSRVPAAWTTTEGDGSVVIAVIDTAVDATHPDLDGAIVDQLSTIEEPADGRQHGTAVTSVIAARSNDEFGMAGVAPSISVLSVAAFAASEEGGPGESSLAAVVEAFDRAADAGADLINASWVTYQDSPVLRAVVADAGVPVVAASGNDGRVLTPTSTSYPAGYDLPNVVSVTAVDASGAVPTFANVGADVVDLGAPGADIVVALPEDEEFGFTHGWGHGTSFAAPHVTGALALARSVAPYATTTELVDTVLWTSRVEAALGGVTRTGGMLDADALVRGIQRPVCRRDTLPAAEFPDVDRRNVHVAGIDCIVATDVTTGRADGTYGPAATVTREQMASFLDRIVTAVDEEQDAPSAGFSDVNPDSAHAPAIDRLAAREIIHGGSDGRFRPGEAVTRGQIAAFLVRTYEHLSEDSQAASRRWFRDIDESPHRDAIDRARDLGLVRGVSRTTFEPTEAMRRDQMASVLAQAIDALARSGMTWP